MNSFTDYINSISKVSVDKNPHQRDADLAESIINDSNEAIIVCKSESIDEPWPLIVYVNHAFEKETGYSAEEVIGKTPRILQGPKTDKATLKKIHDALNKWQPIREEVLNYKKNGEEFWVSLTIFPIANKDGWFTHWVSIQRNITESKRIEFELYSAQSKLLAANTELAFQKNGEKEKRAEELIVANKELNFQNGEKEKRAEELIVANKELSKIQHDLLIAKTEAEKANQAKSKFLAAASHDLRQPLTALSLYVDVLTKQNNGDDSELGKKIQDCVSSLSELLDNLLNVSKLDAGAVVATETTFRLSDTLRSLVNIHGAEAAHKGISLHVRCANLITHTDQTILQRILGNLIANAIRYTEKGGILIGCRHHNGKQWIEVWDSGVGFPSNMAQHIFEEFTQLGDNSRRVGSGLGLAIVGKSAKLLGLELRVHSRPGRGSMFAIEIPHGDAALIETSTEPEAVYDKWMIALVDDNSMVLDATSFALTAMGHNVIVGESELDLLKNIGYQEPDILISDYRLADNKTGLDLILKARRVLGEDLPAILITGDTEPKLIKLFAKHKIKVCYKPLKIDVLNNLISEVMLKS